MKRSIIEARRGCTLDDSASCVVTAYNPTTNEPDFQDFFDGDALRVFEFLLCEAVDGEPEAILAFGKQAGYSISKVAVRYAVRNGVKDRFASIMESVLKDEDARQAAVVDVARLLKGIERDTARAIQWARSGGPVRERRREQRKEARERRSFARWLVNYEKKERARLEGLGKHLNAERAERVST